MTEIERLAKTLATVTFDPETTVTLSGCCTTFFEGSAEDAVRAVLTAMREPSLTLWPGLVAVVGRSVSQRDPLSGRFVRR